MGKLFWWLILDGSWKDEKKKCHKVHTWWKIPLHWSLSRCDNTTFTVAIEKLALKCSSNDELFNHAKTVFDIRFQGRKKEQNEQNVENKNRKIISYTKLDVSIPKLHNQLKNIEAWGALWCSVKKVFLEISQN